MIHRPVTITAIAVGVMLTLCGCSGKGRAEASSAVDSTSVAVEDEVAALSDTVYESAEVVKYVIEVGDSTIGAEIDDLSDMYASAPGAFTFRRGAYRQADFGGRVSGSPTTIEVDWTFTTAINEKNDVWGGGSGWTGQPLYVEWPDSLYAKFRNLGVMEREASKREIIVGSLAAKVYFIDLESGKASREPIDVSNPIKGTVSLDPTLNGNLYVGQGIPDEQPFGAMVIDLFRHKISEMTGVDHRAYRGWGAYDSSPLRVGQFLIRPCENGTLYKYLVEPGELRLQSALRYTVGGSAPGIESSISVYRNYGYFGDNHGNLICVNLNTMKPVWHYALGDDTDATPVVMVEDGHPYVYDGCEIDRQVKGRANFAKIDGLTGREVWRIGIDGQRYDKKGEKETQHFDGGFYGSALPGTGNCSELIFANCVINSPGETDQKNRQNGDFVAIDRRDGRIVYRTPLQRYSWSSPVGFVNERGEMYVVTGDCGGRVYLIEGKSGRIITSRQVGTIFESSPVVIGNSLVVGSRGNQIIKMTIK